MLPAGLMPVALSIPIPRRAMLPLRSSAPCNSAPRLRFGRGTAAAPKDFTKIS
jgi:hypothetical protein